MDLNEQVSLLLAKWDEARTEGRELNPESLCREFPELLPRLLERIDAICAVEQRFSRREATVSSSMMRGDSAATRDGDTPLELTSAWGEAAAGGSRRGGAFDDYELLEMVAEGGMGVVYKARQRSLDRLVALKMIRGDRLRSDSAIKRFYQEARAVAALEHPSIVPIYQIGEQDGTHFFTMAYIEGGSLRDRIRAGQPLAWQEAVRLMTPVADAMAYAHQRGIIHRDLKPHNILIDAQGRPRVADFGLARQVESDAHLTNTGQIVGTPSFMSPEQALGNQSIGPPTDVYALGAILFNLLTGTPPFQGETATQVLCKVITEPAPLVKDQSVPDALTHLCQKCLEKQPEKRFPTATEFAEALRVALSGLSSPGPVTTVPLAAPRIARPVARPIAPAHSLRMPLAVVLLLICGGLLVAFTGWNPFHRQEKTAIAPQRDRLLPPPHRQDFGLRVEVLNHAQPEDGVYQLDNREEVTLRINVDRDAYVGVWTLDDKGKVVQLFPNALETDSLFKAGVSRDIPGNAKYSIAAELSEGLEELRVVAFAKDQLRGADNGPFELNGAPLEVEKWRSTRGLIIRPNPVAAPISTPNSAESSIRYRVQAGR